jgi:hypothetical protein
MALIYADGGEQEGLNHPAVAFANHLELFLLPLEAKSNIPT